MNKENKIKEFNNEYKYIENEDLREDAKTLFSERTPARR